MVKSLRFGELAVNSYSPIFSIVKLWSRNSMYAECFYKFAACFREYSLFCIDLILDLFVCLHLQYAFGNECGAVV